MRFFYLILFILLLALQYRLWVGEGSLAHVSRLESDIVKQENENERLRQRNEVLKVEVKALKNGTDAIEERARSDMGMIKEGETFYMVVEPE